MRVGIVGIRMPKIDDGQEAIRVYKDLKEQCGEFIADLPEGTVVVSGGAPGIDTVAAKTATARGLEVVEYQAHWDLYGKAAGPMRNAQIVEDVDVVVAFWDGKSPGTRSTIRIAQAADKPVEIRLPR